MLAKMGPACLVPRPRGSYWGCAVLVPQSYSRVLRPPEGAPASLVCELCAAQHSRTTEA